MRTLGNFRSAIAITALASTLAAQNVPTKLSPTIARRNEPSSFFTMAIVNGQVTLLALVFAPFGQTVEVSPVASFGQLQSDAVKAHLRFPKKSPSDGPDGDPYAIPPNGPGLNIPDPDEFGFDPWDIPDPPDPFMVPDTPSPFDDPPDPFGDPFDGLPEPPMDLPPLPGADLPNSNFPNNSMSETDENNNDNHINIINTGNTGLARPAENSHSLTPKAIIVTSVQVGLDPFAIAVMPDESAALVTNNGSGTVSIISPTVEIATIPIPGGSPDGIAITPDSKYAYVTNFDNLAPAVYAVDIAGRKVIATMPAGPYPAVVAITPDGSQAWVTSIFGNGLEIIDTMTNTVIKGLAAMPGAWGITFNPSGTRAYVVGSTSGNVYVIDATTYQFVATIPVGPTPRHVICSGRFAFVTNTAADYITQIDTISNTVVRNITVGQTPIGIGFVNTGSQPAPLTVPGEAR